jgi:hypothetical protein
MIILTEDLENLSASGRTYSAQRELAMGLPQQA